MKKMKEKYDLFQNDGIRPTIPGSKFRSIN